MIIVYILAVLIGIPVMAGIFLSDEYKILEEITIQKNKDIVFEYIKLLRNAHQYNKWVMTDPNLSRTFTGTDGVVGFVSAWESKMKQVGKGEQEITWITEGERIDYALRFFEPFEGNANAFITVVPISANETKVSWGFNGKRNFPMRIMHFLLNLKKMLAKDLQTSLANLKKVVEAL
ncbi:MAG: hypothetical protein RLZZ28_348 [Bacteroidota bacterium]|jgi:hypothetical protein